MKKLPLQQPAYRQLEADIREWLAITGYADSTVESLPRQLREFFYYLETAKVFQLEALKKKHLQGFFAYLSSRPNQQYGAVYRRLT